ncbi:drug:proton antiporter [Legionella beliardensis]|uniref:Drug:proton antiporter n=1 Tax=Legionella beliardensis TaxID=91822 RepID=A0A378I1Z0_9GAMM|nr:MFS transporter [Legionella beliardensis]STX28721.1 drug:proton antiporter [Legionella beliardensis]
MFKEQYRLMRQSSFRRFTLSCMLAMFGSGLTYIIMVWVLMRYDASVVSTAILMTCFWLPNVLLGSFFGVLADRWNRHYILIVVTLARALCLFIFACLGQTYDTPLAVYLLATLMGVFLAAYVPAAMSFVRELIPEEDLLYGNALGDMAYEVGGVAGMGCAGFVLATTSFKTCFVINGLCYLFAAIILMRIKLSDAQQAPLRKESFWTQFVKGWRYIKRRPPLLLVYLTQGLFFVSYMTAPVLLAPYAKTVLHSSVSQFGWLESGLSLGIILGSFIAPYCASYFSTFKVIVGQIILGVIGFYLFSHTTSNNLAIFYHLLIGFSFSSWALITTLAQEMTDINYQGRVQSLFNSLSGVVIILFYYLLVQWKNLPIANLYFGEIGILVIAIMILIYVGINNKDEIEVSNYQ